MRIAADVVIDVHIDEVFEFVANPLNDTRWCAKVVYVEQVEGDEPGPGAEYAVVHRPIPLRPPRRMRYVCVDWDPPNRIAWHEDDGHDVIDVRYELGPVWTSTRLTQTDTAQLGAPRLVKPLVKAAIRRDMTRQLRSLRRLLERA